jgi:hypothetical protein
MEAGKPAVVVSGTVGETLNVSGEPGGEACFCPAAQSVGFHGKPLSSHPVTAVCLDRAISGIDADFAQSFPHAPCMPTNVSRSA